MIFDPSDSKYKASAGVNASAHPAMAREEGCARLPIASNTLPPAFPTSVFHGTSQPFESFAANQRGIFFTEDRRVAESYQEIRAGSAPRVIEAVLSIVKPWTYVSYGLDTPYRDMLDQSPRALSRLGYDGIFLPEGCVWVVFDPAQVFVLAEYPMCPQSRRARRAVASSVAV